MTPLLEIVHVSDVHFGSDEPNRLQRMYGVRRASDAAAEALAQAVQRLVNRDGVATVAILSGDLSTLGRSADIGTARFWWAGYAGPGSIYILGNHDFWNGQVVRTAARHASVHQQVRDAHWPPVAPTSVSFEGMRVTIYQVDSTPGERPDDVVTNVLARGARSGSVVTNLQRAIAAHGPWSHGPDIGIVVMHHPVTLLRKGLRGIARLNDNRGINLVLAGHTHRYDMNLFGFVQATCGSSTIVERNKPAPSFLVHALTQNDSSVSLRTTLWKFDGDSFVEGPATPPVEI